MIDFSRDRSGKAYKAFAAFTPGETVYRKEKNKDVRNH